MNWIRIQFERFVCEANDLRWSCVAALGFIRSNVSFPSFVINGFWRISHRPAHNGFITHYVPSRVFAVPFARQPKRAKTKVRSFFIYLLICMRIQTHAVRMGSNLKINCDFSWIWILLFASSIIILVVFVSPALSPSLRAGFGLCELRMTLVQCVLRTSNHVKRIHTIHVIRVIHTLYKRIIYYSIFVWNPVKPPKERILHSDDELEMETNQTIFRRRIVSVCACTFTWQRRHTMRRNRNQKRNSKFILPEYWNE